MARKYQKPIVTVGTEVFVGRKKFVILRITTAGVTLRNKKGKKRTIRVPLEEFDKVSSLVTG